MRWTIVLVMLGNVYPINWILDNWYKSFFFFFLPQECMWRSVELKNFYPVTVRSDIWHSNRKEIHWPTFTYCIQTLHQWWFNRWETCLGPSLNFDHESVWTEATKPCWASNILRSFFFKFKQNSFVVLWCIWTLSFICFWLYKDWKVLTIWIFSLNYIPKCLLIILSDSGKW